MGGFIPLPVENSFTCRIPVRRLRARSMVQFSGGIRSGISQSGIAHSVPRPASSAVLP
jgi:hypothetical protein